MSGRAVFPIAVRMINQVYRAVKLPLIGMGGVASGNDAVEMMLAGASAVAVGTACFTDPMAPVKVRDGIADYLKANNIENVSDLVGQVILHD